MNAIVRTLPPSRRERRVRLWREVGRIALGYLVLGLLIMVGTALSTAPYGRGWQ